MEHQATPRTTAISRAEKMRLVPTGISPDAFFKRCTATEWELIWDAGPYFRRIAAALERAHSYFIFVGWQVDSRIELTTSRHEPFREMVLRLCREKPQLQVYFLMWDHAYVYLFERELMETSIWGNVHDRIHFIFDNRSSWLGSHHEKMVIVDGEVAFSGGIDICDERWDTPRHLYLDRRRSLRHDGERHAPYHDMSVETRGEVVAELVRHVGERWRAVSSIPFPNPPAVQSPGKHTVLMSRTRVGVGLVAEPIVRENEMLFHQLIRSVESTLILENQYYWSKEINDEIISLMQLRAGTGLKILIVLPAGLSGSPAFRMMGAKQGQLISELEKTALATGTRLLVGCPFTSAGVGLKRPIYVHSKVIVVDNRFLAVGSANLNNRAFRLDTELNLTLVGDTPTSRGLIGSEAHRLVAHWGERAWHLIFPDERFLPQAHPDGVIELRDYHAAWAPLASSLGWKVARWFPVERLFDPAAPVAYKFRRWLSQLSRKKRTLFFTLLAAGGMAASVVIAFSVFRYLTGPLTPIRLPLAVTGYLVALTTAWLIPFAVAVGAVCAGLQLGPEVGSAVVLASTVSSGLSGYVFSRFLPRVARRIYRKSSPSWAVKKVGMRRLSVVLAVTASPFLGFQSKIGYQGIYTIPFYAFLVSLGLLSGAHVILSIFAGSVGLYRGQWSVFVVFAAISAVIAAVRVRNRRSKNGGRSIKNHSGVELQHP